MLMLMLKSMHCYIKEHTYFIAFRNLINYIESL